jgi:L-alanine-DL-glutamate epimerase-like enolase superfamily enzyme
MPADADQRGPDPGVADLRLADLRVRAQRLALPRPWGPDVTHLHVLATEVETTAGDVGTGFSWTPRVGARAVEALLRHDVPAAVLGGPVQPEVVWDRLWRSLHEGGGGGLTTIAMAGVDIALWDLRARTAGVSLVDLLGRRRDRVAVYGSGVNRHYPFEELRAQAQRWVDAGYDAVKIKVGGRDVAQDVERVAMVRQVIGPERRLMIDANQLWDLATARRAVARMSPYDLHWVEEPLLADDLRAHARLRALVDVPIAIGENLYTVYQFREALRLEACDIVQPNVVRVGGITPFLRIAALARTGGAQVAPHLLPELSGQLALCLPDPTAVEDVEDATFAHLGALRGPSGVHIERGWLRADTGPGHGLRFAGGEAGVS